MVSCLELRQKFSATSKYIDIELPEKYDDFTGYPTQCYHKFTAVSTHNKENMPEKTSVITGSETKVSFEPSTGFVPYVYLFCGFVRKSVAKSSQRVSYVTV